MNTKHDKQSHVVVQCYHGPFDGLPIFCGREELKVGRIMTLEGKDRYVLLCDASERFEFRYIYPTAEDAS